MTATARFIGGTGRCGTAALGEAFNRHPKTIYFREPRIVPDPGGLAVYVRGVVTLERFKAAMLSDGYRDLTMGLAENGLGHDEIQAAYAWKDVERLLDAMTGIDRIEDARRFLLALFGRAGKPYWVDKTPHTVRYVDLLYQMFGEGLRYIHLIREPRDVVSSLKPCSWGPKGVDRFCTWYEAIMGDARQAYGQVPPECYLVLEMEEMVQQSHSVVPRAFDFFEIPAEPGWLFDVAKAIRPSDAHVGRYVDDLSRKEQREVSERCRPLYLWWKGKANHG